MTTAHASIRSAFHELTLTLLGLFEVYGADPALVEHAADEIESILRRHLGAPRHHLAVLVGLDRAPGRGAVRVGVCRWHRGLRAYSLWTILASPSGGSHDVCEIGRDADPGRSRHADG